MGNSERFIVVTGYESKNRIAVRLCDIETILEKDGFHTEIRLSGGSLKRAFVNETVGQILALMNEAG